MKANFGQTAKDYRKYRAGFPRSFFQTLKEKNLIEGSETVIDLGTGTGTVARGLASLGCEVTGIDPAEALLVQAKEIAEAENISINTALARMQYALQKLRTHLAEDYETFVQVI